MMKKALLLSGSPRAGGNTDDCLGFVASKLANAGMEVSTIHMRNMNIKPCTGCRTCMKLNHCVIQDDDFEKIWEQMKNSNLLIMAAPVFWYSPPGHMKIFIDRMHGYYAVPNCLSNLKAALLSVAGDDGCWEPHEQIMRSCLTCCGSAMLPQCRILAREKGEAFASENNRQKLESWVAKLLTGV